MPEQLRGKIVASLETWNCAQRAGLVACANDTAPEPGREQLLVALQTARTTLTTRFTRFRNALLLTGKESMQREAGQKRPRHRKRTAESLQFFLSLSLCFPPQALLLRMLL